MGKPVTGVAGWRAWFKGGSTFDSVQTKPEDLPKTGCLLVMIYFEPERNNRRYNNGSDLYFWQQVDGDVIIGSTGSNNAMGVADLVAKYPGAVVIEGEWTTDAEMAQITDLAMASVVP